MTWKGRLRRATGAAVQRGLRPPRFQLPERAGARGVEHRKAPEAPRGAGEPQGSCGSHGDPQVPDWTTPWGADSRELVRQDPRDKAREGNRDGFGRPCGLERTLRRGAQGPWSRPRTRAVPERTAQRPGVASASHLVFLRARGVEVDVGNRSQGRGDALRPPLERASQWAENPRSGSGPRDREVEGAETVEGVENPEGGTCRVRQTRVERILSLMSLEGRRTPGGEALVLGPEPVSWRVP